MLRYLILLAFVRFTLSNWNPLLAIQLVQLFAVEVRDVSMSGLTVP